MELICFTL